MANWPRRLALAALLAALGGCRTAAPPPRPTRVPDPLPPPAAARPLTQREQMAIYLALAAAERGDANGARQAFRRAPTDHPTYALASLEVRFLLQEAVSEEAHRLALVQPNYRQAWEFAAQALEAEGRLTEALEVARSILQGGGDAAAARRVRQLESQVLGRVLNRAQAALAKGDPAEAIAEASRGLSLVPGAVSLLEILTRAHLAVGDVPAAARLVAALPDDAEGLELKGRIAAAGQQWELAAEFFSRLPPAHPGRCALWGEARQRSRLAQAPPYVQRALTSGALTRAELAALVVWEVPAVVERAQGAAALFEDIVNLSERRDIVTVVRAGMMDGDNITRSFFPQRRARARELMEVAERLTIAFGRPRPQWCGEDRPAGCVEVPSEPVTGELAASLLRRLTVGGDEVCP